MKSVRPIQASENKSNDLSLGEMSRVKLPRLQKPLKKVKKPTLKGNRLESTPSKYEQLAEEIQDLQNCISKKYGKSIKFDCLKKMQKSITSLNQDMNKINKNLCIKSAKEPCVKSTSSSDVDEVIPPTKHLSKWSKRVLFKKRPEMENKNLVVVNFEGVIGDVYKDNIWVDQREKIHKRKGVCKGLKDLINNFQVVLFFHTQRINYQKILDFLEFKNIYFDAVYVSENSTQWDKNSSGRFKKPLKYSEYFQNYFQISVDFGIQHDILGKMLVLTSACIDTDEDFSPNINILIKNFSKIPQYLCKAVPTVKNPELLLPITLVVADSRMSNEGNSFGEISGLIKKLVEFSEYTDERSWLDGYARLKADPQMNCIAFESTGYQYSLAKDNIIVTKDQLESYKKPLLSYCTCPNEFRPHCKFKEYGHCTSLKNMKGYLIAGKEIPVSMLKNKFIVLKLHDPFPYKIINYEI